MTPLQRDPLLAISALCKHPGLVDHYQEMISWAHQSMRLRLDTKHLFLQVLMALPADARGMTPLMIQADAGKHAMSDFGMKASLRESDIMEGASKLIERIQADQRGATTSEESVRAWLEAEIYHNLSSEEPRLLPDGTLEDPLGKATGRHDLLRAKPMVNGDTEGIVSLFGSSEIDLGDLVPLGIPPMDEYVLHGGISKKSVVMLTGGSNVGKSRLGLHCLVQQLLMGESVFLGSGEDSWQMTRARAFATLLQTDSRAILAMDDQQRERQLSIRLEQLEELNRIPGLAAHIRRSFMMQRFKAGEMTPQSFHDKIKETQDISGKTPTMIMADYLQAATPNNGARKNEQTDQQLERFVREAEDVCVECDTLALIISQAKGNQVGKSTINLQDASARSYAAIQASQYVVTMLQSTEELNRRIHNRDQGSSIDIVLCKAKDSGLGACYAITDPARSSFRFFASKTERDAVAAQTNQPGGFTGTSRLDPQTIHA